MGYADDQIAAMTTMPDMDPPRWLTPAKAAKEMGKSRRTIYGWMQKGGLIIKRTPSGLPVILASSLLRPDTVYAKKDPA